MTNDDADNTVRAIFQQLESRHRVNGDWIRSVRVQRNMQGKQLAEKMHVSPARISVLEKDEQRGAVTLKMMHKAAEALDCDFVYALIPKRSRQAAKPRVRLDSSYMNGDENTREVDLERAFERKLLRTVRD